MPRYAPVEFAEDAAPVPLRNLVLYLRFQPAFPALLPAVLNVRARSIPWVLWLHDLLPDGAAATGLVDEGGTVLKLARRLERAAQSLVGR